MQAARMVKVVFAVLVLAVAAGVAAGSYSGGTGEPNNPYRIATANDLNDIGNHPEDWGSHFVMVNDVNLGEYTGTEFNVIGNGTSWFTGVFDGNGHTISNFTYHCTGSEEYVGIFGYVRAADAEIRDLGLIAADVNGGTESPALWVGSLVGFLSSGSIARCYAAGARISGGVFVGGLVGGSQLSGTITDCAFTGTLLEAEDAVGGLAASGGGTMSNCYSIASISSSGVVGWGAGGLVGLGGGTFSNCYSNGSVSVSGGSIGGLVGVGFSSVISNCYSTVNLEGCSGSVGGLVGTSDYAYVQVTASFWDLESSGIATSGGGEGKMTADMQDANTFISAGWDFNTPVWRICEREDYPRLWREKYGGGLGTAAVPYLIRTSCQMQAIGAEPNDWDKHFLVVNDINMGGLIYTTAVIAPDTSTAYDFQGTPFTGVFDGDEHIVSNLTIDTAEANNCYLGLFGLIDDSGQVRNLGIEGVNITGGYDSYRLGGLVGSIGEDAYNPSSIITNCYASGSVSGGGWSGNVGGLCGSNYGTISECYATASVTGHYSLGGLVGIHCGKISNCCADGTVTGDTGVGGLVGGHYGGNISDCYADGNVTGDVLVGGLVGDNYVGNVSDCYAHGTVTGDGRVGGLLGGHIAGDISDCYAAARVPAGYGGGLVGSKFCTLGSFNSCFWDSDVNPDVEGIPYHDYPNVIGKTTAEMQDANTFISAGWDFVGETANGTEDIWDICEGTNYPRLVWQIPAGDFLCPDGVNFIDYAYLSDVWDTNDPNADLDLSGLVDPNDLKIFCEEWLEDTG